MLRPVGLSRGLKTIIANEAAVGTDTSHPFSVISGQSGPHTVEIQMEEAIAACAGNIESSIGGSSGTWKVLAAFDLVAQKVLYIDIVPGSLYRLNFTTVTGDAPDVWATFG